MIKIKNLNINYQKEVIYNDFDLVLKKGEKLALTGKSGSGKSTLLNLLAGFIPDFKGQVSVNNIVLNSETINEIRKLISWLPQEVVLKFDSVSELFFAPFEFALNKDKKPSKQDIDHIFNTLELSTSLLSKDIKEISGGQKQRIVLASCLLLNKPILLIDEPTSALDNSIKKKVADYILNKNDLTVIAATHDNYWAENSDKTVHLG